MKLFRKILEISKQKIGVMGLTFMVLIVSQTTIKANENLSLQLLWKNQFEFAGFYIAKEKGFYKDLGLDVEIKEYQFGVDIVNDVANQKSDIGIGRTSLILEKLNGKDISLLFSTFQSSPHVLIGKKRDDLQKIEDFKNKKIMYSDDLESIAAISAMMKVGNIKTADYIKLPHSFNIEDVINGKTDLMSVYMSNEPFELMRQNIEFTLFNPKDYGFDFYSDIAFTSSTYLEKNEKNIQKFIKASQKGWEYAFAHIDETAEIILKNYNTQHKSKDALIYEAKILKELAFQKNIPFGTITYERVEELANLYRLMGKTTSSNEMLHDLIYEPMTIITIIKNFFPPQVILFMILCIAIVLFLFWYKQYILKQQNINLEKIVDEKTKALQLLNENLEIEVQERTKELQKQKNELKTIFENSKDGIAILDFNTKFLLFNDAYVEMTGYSKEELGEKTCLDMTVIEDLERTKASLEELHKNGFIKNFEKTCIKKDGTSYFVNLTQTILPHSQKILVTTKDVTLIKEHEKFLYEQSKISSMSEVLHNIAHQWRQPLSSISIRATGVLYKNEMGLFDKEEVIHTLEEINTNTQYLSKTIDTFQHYLNQTSQSEIVFVNPTELIEKALLLIESSLKNDNIELFRSVKISDCKIKIDEIEFVEIILNIVNNARDQFNTLKREERWIKIETLCEDGKFIITIEDSAGGVPTEIIEKIFEPYFTTKHQAQGTGLSLHMCYQSIVNKLHGKIFVQNTKNGALFTIEIPIK